MPIKKAPRPNTGDIIELEPLLNKPLAVTPLNRRSVETKFGERSLTEVRVFVVGQKDPIEGVLFQSYFNSLELHETVAGILKKDTNGQFTRWYLDSDSLNAKQLKELENMVSQYDDEVPF